MFEAKSPCGPAMQPALLQKGCPMLTKREASVLCFTSRWAVPVLFSFNHGWHVWQNFMATVPLLRLNGLCLCS
eukprot:1139858-Pelagomonas_calceolata.AAC.6